MPKDAKWCGCATLNTDDPKLWIVEQSNWPDCESQGFTLSEVIAAGLHAKVTGLSDADRDAAIAECVADTLDTLTRLHESLTACQLAIHGCRSANSRKGKMFFRESKLIAHVRRVMGWVGGGVHKRIDENRELLELLRNKVPDFVAAHPEVVSWLQSQDDFLCELADRVPITEGQFLSLTKSPTLTFPRLWPGETVESLERQAAVAARRV
ncbi:MAG TPA: hypothetical protein VJU59_10350 [Paraburkholderia sp.]|uniref:hypothetical protein n=1 Tax=Paraburkholderia sp. TaxID=1926495 RepID=UPI002B45EC0A|nr:hypothetical protein [Paraburkholderia sp.]HKR40057.1 hypothetical protein [Paraburkholderia sp.]